MIQTSVPRTTTTVEFELTASELRALEKLAIDNHITLNDAIRLAVMRELSSSYTSDTEK